MPEDKPNTTTAIALSRPVEVVEARPVATNYAELPTMQRSLIDWARSKLVEVRKEEQELREAYEQAIERKWKSGVLKTHAAKALQRVTYYEKVLAALEAGYCLFPPVDCEIFAIRTDKKSPNWRSEWIRYGNPTWEESGPGIPAGEGRYVEPIPLHDGGRYEAKTEKNAKGEPYQVHGVRFTTSGDWDRVEFPLSMAKPQIMDEAAKAMALKIFDEIGIFGDTGRRAAVAKQDPVIVGRIIDRSKTEGYPARKRRLSFLICWHVDTKGL